MLFLLIYTYIYIKKTTSTHLDAFEKYFFKDITCIKANKKIIPSWIYHIGVFDQICLVIIMYPEE